LQFGNAIVKLMPDRTVPRRFGKLTPVRRPIRFDPTFYSVPDYGRTLPFQLG
jgi:hypothetical protein